jgi:hypothetical protein
MKMNDGYMQHNKLDMEAKEIKIIIRYSPTLKGAVCREGDMK